MKRKQLRQRSKKFIDRARQVKPFRDNLIANVGCCERCLRRLDPYDWKAALCCHEIAGGPLRQVMLDKAFGILVLCQRCHPIVQAWPRARQLALLSIRRPDDYDLPAFNAIVYHGAVGITQTEVDAERLFDGDTPY